MNTCCPNCSSTSAIGNQAASACAECLSVSVAGASLPIGLVVVGALFVGVCLLVRKMLGELDFAPGRVCRSRVIG